MTDQVGAVAETPAAPQAIPMAEGLARYRASKEAAKSEANPVSEAARTLGQRAAAARAEARQAQAAQTEEAPEGEAQQNDAEDDSAPVGETLDETATGESPNATEDATEEEPADTQTIDLGDGVKVTLDEVRDGFMMKADHTRKTQALAEDRKSFEAARTQKLTELENAAESLKQLLPQPKDQDAFIEELGVEEGLKAFSRQNKQLQALVGVYKATEAARTKAIVDAETARDTDLAENYNKEWADAGKREKAYTALTAYAMSLGADASQLKGLPAFVLKAIDKASKYDATEANKGKITKLFADKPKVTKPGSKVSAQASQQTNIQAGFSRLKSSGNISDAVALLRAMRGGKRG